jgi:riboflavin biosynthesis pyrimidine reductase
MDLAYWHDEHRQDLHNADARCRCILIDGSSQLVHALLVDNVVDALHMLISPLPLGGKRCAREGARGLIAGGSVAALQAVADQIGAAGGAAEAV